MQRTIRLAISTCPNDTFAFHALINRLIDWRGLDFQMELLDIQTLNERLLEGSLDVAKTSFYTALLLAKEYGVFSSGSALGFGVGPLLLSSRQDSRPSHVEQLTLCPGQHTTATLLFRLFHPHTTRMKQVVFSEIMPALQRKEADFGVCIHEGRFTWQDAGLYLVEDLGTRWEETTKAPLPLGGIIGAFALGMETLQQVQELIRESLLYALEHPDAPLPTMRKYAQEFNDEVLKKHVELYVNQWTVDLGQVGKNALAELSRRAAEVGLLTQETELKTIES